MAARTVAIWGSCVTRDAFAVASRREQLEEELPLVYYAARSSWISQASQPWPQTDPELGGEVSGFGLRMVQEDLNKSIIDRLAELKPDIVVLDLIDERLPIARVGRTWLTVSDYAKQTALVPRVVAAADETCSMTQPARARLFAAAARTVARRLTRELPRTAFVLNEAPYTTRVGDGTTLSDPAGGWARDLEAAQQPLLRAVVRQMGDRLFRARPPQEVCLADPDHRWGVTSYHYVEDYYHWLIDTLRAIEPPSEPGRGASIRLPDVPSLRGLLRR
ncbi:MAG: DUF6270 domain-containing protein [Kineosporiaceae bacterium]